MTTRRISPRDHERVYRAIPRGLARSKRELERQTGMAPQTVQRLTSGPPDLCGFTLDQAEAIRAQGVALETARTIVRTYATATVTEQAARLATTPHAVRVIRSRLRAAGVLDLRQSVYAKERRRGRDGHLVSRVCDLCRRGYSSDAIAAELQQPAGRVRKIIAAQGGAEHLRADGLSLEEVAALFSVTSETARWWVDQDWLTATRNPGPRGRWRVSWAALRGFVRCRAGWPSYTARLITNADLRAVAEEQQARAGGQWRTRKELAAALNVAEPTLRHWIATCDWLADWETTRYGKTIYHWQCDGASLTPPPNARKGVRP
jgi:hypothetical protein